MVVPTLLPRSTQIELEIPVGTKLPAGRVHARVMKTQMMTREPLYGLGLRFEDADCEIVRRLRDEDESEPNQ